MNVAIFLIPLAITLAMVFLALFILSVKKGQYEDLDTPPQRMLLDDDILINNTEKKGMEND